MLFQTCMIFVLMLNTKEGILKNAVIQQLMVPIDFHSMSFPTMEVSRKSYHCLFSYIILCTFSVSVFLSVYAASVFIM